MELRHLRYFVAVAEEENVTRAAARLNVSQPPLSRQVRDLEEELGVDLFQRTAKSLRLTDAGKVFLAEARSILLKVDIAVTNVRVAAKGAIGELHVAYAPSPTGELLPRLLHAFEEEIPGMRVTLHELTSAEMMSGLRSKRLHVALTVEHGAAVPRGLNFDSLRRDCAGVLIPKDHRLAKRRRLRPEELMSESFAVYSRKEYPEYHDWLRRIFGPRTRELRIAEECDGALSLIAAVHARKTLAVVAESVQSIAGSKAAFVPLASAPPLRVGIFYPADLPKDSPAFRFVAISRKVAAEGEGG